MTEPAPLMAGKRGLIMGVANDRSLAWGIARTAHAHGANLAFTYQGEVLRRRVVPLAESVGSERWGTLDFVVHAIAYSDKDGLKGRYIETSAEIVLACDVTDEASMDAAFAATMNVSVYSNFQITMNVSVYSFTAAGAQHP